MAACGSAARQAVFIQKILSWVVAYRADRTTKRAAIPPSTSNTLPLTKPLASGQIKRRQRDVLGFHDLGIRHCLLKRRLSDKWC